MKYTRTSLWFLAVAGMLSVAVITGCGPKNPPAKDVKDKDKDKDKEKEEEPGDTYKFSKVDFGTDAGFNNLAVSGDNNVYVSNGSKLVTAAAADIADGSKWKGITLGDTGLDGSAAHSKLTGAVVVNNLVATAKGALVEVAIDAKKTLHEGNGVGYVEGATWVAAWDSKDKTHVDFATFSDPYKEALRAIAVLKNEKGEEVPFLFKTSKQQFIFGAPLNAPAKLTKWVALKKLKNFSDKVFAVMAGDDALIVDADFEVRLYPKAAFAKTDNPNSEDLLGASINAWKLGGIENNGVTAVEYANNQLFIALKSLVAPNNTKTGGVIVYAVIPGDAKKATSIKMADATKLKDWLGTSVWGFAKNGDKVFAVTAAGLTAIGADGAKGADLKVEGLDAGIKSAKFVGDSLVVISKDGSAVLVGSR